MELWQKQAIFTQAVAVLIKQISAKGFDCTLGECYRTPEQAAIYAKEGKGIVDSLHCKRLAIDINLFDKKGQYLTAPESYQQFGDLWETLNPKFRWGGHFSRGDGNHFEMQDT